MPDERGLPPSSGYGSRSSRSARRPSSGVDGRLIAGAALLLVVIGLIWAVGGGGDGDGSGTGDSHDSAPAEIEERPAVLSAPPPETAERSLRRAARMRRAVLAKRRAERRQKASRRKSPPAEAPLTPQPQVPPPAPSVPTAPPPPVPSGIAPEFL